MMHVTCVITIAALLYPLLTGTIPLAGAPFIQEMLRVASDLRSSFVQDAPYASLIIIVFISFLLVGSKLLPGALHSGTELKDKTRKVYKCNGLLLLISLLVTFFTGAHFNLWKATVFADYASTLAVLYLLLCVALATWLYCSGSTHPDPNLVHPLSNSVLWNWTMGVTLNPTFFGEDMKFFWLRPSMMGWIMLNIGWAATQVSERGSLSHPMLLTQLFNLAYVFDYFYVEAYMTTTWDIIAENFGFMLVFGDTMFIQFVFSIPSWLICRQPPASAAVVLDSVSIAICIATFSIGYFIFRVSNKQKHDFKADSTCLIWGRPAQTIGGKLLISGFWGYARHINYLGDLIVGLSFSLPAWFGGCGLASFVYPIYLLVLLLHRDWRDDAKCCQKYKELWTEYTSKVPYRMLPWVY
jgi:steroid 5-alpha reductase family enzyme